LFKTNRVNSDNNGCVAPTGNLVVYFGASDDKIHVVKEQ
jgi:hypothetical protein